MGKIKILEDKVDASSKRVARVSMLAIGVDRKKEISTEHINRVLILMEEGRHNIPLLFLEHKKPNCITGNVTEGSIVASGKMLLSDRRKSQSEEQHDEPEK